MTLASLNDISIRRANGSLQSQPGERLGWLLAACSFILVVFSFLPCNVAPNTATPSFASSSYTKRNDAELMDNRRSLRIRHPSNRRLAEHATTKRTLVVTAVSPSTRTPVNVTSPSTAPIATPPVTQKPGNSSSSSGSSYKFSATQAVPAIMVGVASSIIVCALFFYVTDVKDRCRHDDWVRAHQQRQLQQQPSLNALVRGDVADATFERGDPRTSSSSSLSFNKDSCTISCTTGDDRPSVSSSRGVSALDAACLLPPIVGPDDDLLDPMEIMCLEFPMHLRSFSQVSTITGSYLGCDRSPEWELFEDFDTEQSSLGITELNDIYRLDQNADLTSLVSMKRLRAPSPIVSRSLSSASTRGLAPVEETTNAVRNDHTSVISGKHLPTTQESRNEETDEEDDFINKETTSPITILGLVPDSSYENDNNDLVDTGNAIIDEDVYILHIHCDDGDSVGGDCVESRHWGNESDENANNTFPSGGSSSSESVSMESDFELASPPRTEEMMYVSDDIPMKKMLPYAYNVKVPPFPQKESRDVEVNRLANVRETPDGFEVQQDQRMEAPLCNEALQLEQLISSIPFDHLQERIFPSVVDDGCIVLNATTPTNEFVRDIYFVPVPLSNPNDELLTTLSPSKSVLGLELYDASSMVTHPTVADVAMSSPLAGRIFEGDFVLRVNDAETAGLSGDNIHRLITCIQLTPINSMGGGGVVAKMIKLTVMSSQSDGSEGESIDLGILETALEV